MKTYKELQNEINKLPSGSITRKNIKGKDYYYYRYYDESNKRKEKYIPFNEVEELEKKIKERKELEAQQRSYIYDLHNISPNYEVRENGFRYCTDDEEENASVKNEIIKFVDNDLELDVSVSNDRENVWLSIEQMTQLFGRDRTVITRHINNIFNEGELDKKEVCANFAHTTKHGYNKNGTQTRVLEYFNLDLILSVGYRVNSKQGIAFRKWATNILKDYMMKGYAVNQRRIDALNKTVEIQSRMLASSLELDSNDVLYVVNKYTEALDLLDDYDHQRVRKPKGNDSTYELTYAECRKLIDSMKFAGTSDVFGVEKEQGKLNGILAAVYQNVFGQEVYPSIEEKAANLLYFLIKDHPFADGCKRIGATLFLEFLNKNKYLMVNGRQTISNSALVAITLLIAESKPEEKDIMVKLVMNFLNI